MGQCERCRRARATGPGRAPWRCVRRSVLLSHRGQREARHGLLGSAADSLPLLSRLNTRIGQGSSGAVPVHPGVQDTLSHPAQQHVAAIVVRAPRVGPTAVRCAPRPWGSRPRRSASRRAQPAASVSVSLSRVDRRRTAGSRSAVTTMRRPSAVIGPTAMPPVAAPRGRCACGDRRSREQVRDHARPLVSGSDEAVRARRLRGGEGHLRRRSAGRRRRRGRDGHRACPHLSTAHRRRARTASAGGAGRAVPSLCRAAAHGLGARCRCSGTTRTPGSCCVPATTSPHSWRSFSTRSAKDRAGRRSRCARPCRRRTWLALRMPSAGRCSPFKPSGRGYGRSSQHP
ncbi:UNVERIFIED_CONTAM: hypothetical protein RKD50_000617 [Streptomyces canus]